MTISANSTPATQSHLASVGQSPLVATFVDVHGTSSRAFVERRENPSDSVGSERRQFGSSHSDLSPDAKELAIAIDRYKIENRRRYITCEEMLAVMKSLGYHRD
jgi:hypothetical protein